MDNQIPIAEGLFSWPDNAPALIGGHCAECGWIAFPKGVSCPRCGAEQVDARRLPTEGKLWSWTIQAFAPKAPYRPPETASDQVGDSEPAFSPYGVGYIQLGNDVIVESRLTECDPDKLTIGMVMELVIQPYRRSEDGRWLMSYAFQPKANTQKELA